jgi:hypothetical protein
MPSSRWNVAKLIHVNDFSTTPPREIASAKQPRPMRNAVPVKRMPIGAPLPGVFFPRKTIRKKAEMGRIGTRKATCLMPPLTIS